MRKYEILLLLRPNLEAGVKSNTIKLVEELIGGKIIKKEEWGLKKLAYPVKKEVEADYTLYYVETNGENIVELKARINIIKEILRAMILVHEKDFPFNMKTTKDLKFPERKARPERKPYTRKPEADSSDSNAATTEEEA